MIRNRMLLSSFCPNCYLASVYIFTNDKGYEMVKCGFCGYTESHLKHDEIIDEKIEGLGDE